MTINDLKDYFKLCFLCEICEEEDKEYVLYGCEAGIIICKKCFDKYKDDWYDNK